MRLFIQPGAMEGQLRAPPSKSYTIRAAALALLATGESVIHNVGHSDDEGVAVGLLGDLGARVKRVPPGTLYVQSEGLAPRHHTLFCGESALVLRLFTAVAALLPLPMQLSGIGSLLLRPQTAFANIFPSLGVEYASNDERPPLFVQGCLKPVDLSIDGSISSQFATGLLIAYAASGAQNVTLHLEDPKSKPYLGLTLALLSFFGCRIAHRNYQYFRFGDKQKLSGATVHVPGDWSSAAYLLVAAVLSGTLTLSGLSQDSLQADKAIVAILELARCHILHRYELEGTTSSIEVLSSPVFSSFQCDLEHSPDIFPAIAALAAFAKGTSYLSGVHRLIHKESNRATAIIDLLTQVGVRCEKKGDTLCIEGRDRIDGGITVSGRSDHRIVMMASLLALRSGSGLYIDGCEAVAKSFPDFFKYLQQVGIPVQEPEQTA